MKATLVKIGITAPVVFLILVAGWLPLQTMAKQETQQLQARVVVDPNQTPPKGHQKGPCSKCHTLKKPLEMSDLTLRALVAAERQNKTTSFQHKILEATQPLSKEDILLQAKRSGLDVVELEKDMQSQEIKKKAQESKDLFS